MKRFFAMLLCMAMVFSLCACGEDEAAATETTGATETTAPVVNESDYLQAVVVFGHNLTDAQVESINHRLQPFYARFPGVEVVFKQLEGPVTAENAPTVLLCTPEQVPAYRDAGLLMDLNNWIDSMGWVSYHGSTELHNYGLNAEVKEDMDALLYEEGKNLGDEATYLLPFSANILTMYYNKTFFEENELNIYPSLTWEELLENCKKIKEMDPESVPIAINDVDDTFISLCAQYDLSFTADGWQSLLGEKGMAIAKKLNNMYQKGYLTTSGQRGGVVNLKENPNTPRSYITIGSSAYTQGQIPELVNEAYAYEVDVMSLSRMTGETPKLMTYSNGLAICKSDDDDLLTAAWLLVKFMSTEASFQGGMAKDTGSLPTVRSAWLDEEFGMFLNEANGGSGLSGLVAMMTQDQDSYRFTAQAFPGSAEIREQIAALIEQCITFTGDVDTQIAAAFESTLAACTE